MEEFSEESIKSEYSLNLLNEMKILRHAEYNRDITVKSGRNEYSINSLVFACSCLKFRRDIQICLSNGEVMHLDDWGIPETGFEKCIEFMYSGGTEICASNALDVLKSANCLGLKSLIDFCILWFGNNFKKNLIVDIRDLCLRFKISAQSIFVHSLNTISTSNEFLSMTWQELSSFFKGDVFANDGDKLILITKWMLHDKSARLSYFPCLIQTTDKDVDSQQAPIRPDSTKVKQEAFPIHEGKSDEVKYDLGAISHQEPTVANSIPTWMSNSLSQCPSTSTQLLNETIRRPVEIKSPDHSIQASMEDGAKIVGNNAFASNSKRPANLLNESFEIKKKKTIAVTERRYYIAISQSTGNSIRGIDLENHASVILTSSSQAVEEFDAVSYANDSLYWLRGVYVKKRRKESKHWNKVESISLRPTLRAQIVVWKDRICIIDKKKVHILNSHTDIWESPHPLKDIGNSFCLCTNQDHLYIIGGKETDRRVLRYNFVNRQTCTLAPTIKPRVKSSAASIKSKIYVMGGSGNTEIARSMEVYDREIDMWMQLSDMTKPRTNLRACVYEDRIYAVGGDISSSGGSMSSVEMYDTSSPHRGWMSIKQINKLREPFFVCVANTYQL